MQIRTFFNLNGWGWCCKNKPRLPRGIFEMNSSGNSRVIGRKGSLLAFQYSVGRVGLHKRGCLQRQLRRDAQLIRCCAGGRNAATVPVQVGNAATERFYRSCEMDDYGIIFDIDGVLVHGRKPLRGGREAVEFCVEQSVPYVFVTNNAMDLESERSALLASILNTEVLTERMIVAHSPLVELSDEVKAGLVLVTGFSTRDVRDLLTFKGFQNVKTVREFAQARPYLVPNKLYPGQKAPAYEDPDLVIGKEKEKISAVVVVENSTDWHEDLQVILDVLVSDGQVGVDSDEQVVDLYCCNYDFVFATGFRLPRLGPGAFVRCLEMLYKETTGNELTIKRFGKPFPPAYKFAERRLREQTKSGNLPDTIYMVGDNPRSDIRGANHAGKNYKSILVRTGVFHEDLENDPTDPADYVVQDVAEAMELIRSLHS